MASILECLDSRWGTEGLICEADFSQLEVIGLAHLSQDETLIQDILDAKDMHCVSASFLSGESYEHILKEVKASNPVYKKMRKDAKAPSFQLQYGAGYRSIAESCKISEDLAKTFVLNYYTRYARIKEWQEENIQQVRSSAKHRGSRTGNGYPAKTGFLESETGRRYMFHECDAPDFLQKKGTLSSFAPTNIKNYPVQGFATGDIVPMVLGELVQKLKQDKDLRDKALLINTVHDSVILDVHASVLDKAKELVQDVMQSAPKLLKRDFGIDFLLPLNASFSSGRTWKQAKENE